MNNNYGNKYLPTVPIVIRGTISPCSLELVSAIATPSALPHSTAAISPFIGIPASVNAKLAAFTQAAKAPPSALILKMSKNKEFYKYPMHLSLMLAIYNKKILLLKLRKIYRFDFLDRVLEKVLIQKLFVTID